MGFRMRVQDEGSVEYRVQDEGSVECRVQDEQGRRAVRCVAAAKKATPRLTFPWKGLKPCPDGLTGLSDWLTGLSVPDWLI